MIRISNGVGAGGICGGAGDALEDLALVQMVGPGEGDNLFDLAPFASDDFVADFVASRAHQKQQSLRR